MLLRKKRPLFGNESIDVVPAGTAAAGPVVGVADKAEEESGEERVEGPGDG